MKRYTKGNVMKSEAFKVTYEMVGGWNCTSGTMKSRKSADAKFAKIVGASDVTRAWLYERIDGDWIEIDSAICAGSNAK